MTLNIGESLRNGLDRATNRNAGVLFVLFFLLTLVSTVVTNSASVVSYNRLLELLQETAQEPLPSVYEESIVSSPLAIPMSLGVALVLVVVMWVAGEAVRVISDRTFISEETEQLHEPTRWLGWATLSSFGFAIIFNSMLIFYSVLAGILVILSPLAALLWVLVGGVGLIVLSVFFFFTRQEIASRDVGPIEAMSGSWSLVRNNEIEVFGLGIVLAFFGVVNQAVFFALSQFGQLPATVVNLLIGSALLVFFSAVVAQAYRQLRAEPRADGSETADVEPETAGEPLNPNDEWNDPPL